MIKQEQGMQVVQSPDTAEANKIQVKQKVVVQNKQPQTRVLSQVDTLSKNQKSRNTEDKGDSRFSDTLLGEENISALQRDVKFSKIIKDHSSQFQVKVNKGSHGGTTSKYIKLKNITEHQPLAAFSGLEHHSHSITPAQGMNKIKNLPEKLKIYNQTSHETGLAFKSHNAIQGHYSSAENRKEKKSNGIENGSDGKWKFQRVKNAPTDSNPKIRNHQMNKTFSPTGHVHLLNPFMSPQNKNEGVLAGMIGKAGKTFIQKQQLQKIQNKYQTLHNFNDGTLSDQISSTLDGSPKKAFQDENERHSSLVTRDILGHQNLKGKNSVNYTGRQQQQSTQLNSDHVFSTSVGVVPRHSLIQKERYFTITSTSATPGAASTAEGGVVRRNKNSNTSLGNVKPKFDPLLTQTLLSKQRVIAEQKQRSSDAFSSGTSVNYQNRFYSKMKTQEQQFILKQGRMTFSKATPKLNSLTQQINDAKFASQKADNTQQNDQQLINDFAQRNLEYISSPNSPASIRSMNSVNPIQTPRTFVSPKSKQTPRTQEGSLQKVPITSNEWLTKKYFLEAENRTTHPIMVADALSTIYIEDHLRQNMNDMITATDFDTIKKRAASTVLYKKNTLENEVNNQNRVEEYYKYRAQKAYENRRKIFQAKNESFYQTDQKPPKTCETAQQNLNYLRDSLIDAKEDLKLARQNIRKKSMDEHLHFTNMLTNLKNLFTDVNEIHSDHSQEEQKPAKNKPLMSEAEQLQIEQIEGKVEEILEKVSHMPEKDQIVKELRFATNKYIPTSQAEEENPIPVSNYVLNQKRRMLMAFLTNISADIKEYERKQRTQQDQSSMVFSFGVASSKSPLAINEHRYSSLKLPKPERNKLKNSGSKSDASIAHSSQSSQKSLKSTSPFKTPKNATKSILKNSGKSPKSSHGNGQLASLNVNKRKAENIETAEMMLKLTIQEKSSEVKVKVNERVNDSKITRSSGSSALVSPTESIDKKTAKLLFEEAERLENVNMAKFTKKMKLTKGSLKHQLEESGKNQIEIIGKPRFENQVRRQNMKRVIDTGDKFIFKIANDRILAQANAAQKKYTENTFTSPGMSHPRMDYIILPLESKNHVHEKCTGDVIKAGQDEDTQDFNLFYSNQHIKDQGVTYLKQIQAEV